MFEWIEMETAKNREEYGLPRMISKKVQNTGLINLEDDTKEINAVINEFLNVGVDKLVSSMKNLLPFDLYITEVSQVNKYQLACL